MSHRREPTPRTTRPPAFVPPDETGSTCSDCGCPETWMAWAAGMFEGEGSIFWHTSKGRGRVQMSSTDYDVLERFARVVGCGRVYGPYQPSGGRRLRWDWLAEGPTEPRQVVAMLWPYLGERRRAKAVEVGLAPVEVVR